MPLPLVNRFNKIEAAISSMDATVPDDFTVLSDLFNFNKISDRW